MSEEIFNLKEKLNKKLENYELDKKFGQMSVDSIYHMFPSEIETLLNYIENKEKSQQDFIKWLESKNEFHYKNGKIEDNYILVSEVLNKVRGD